MSSSPPEALLRDGDALARSAHSSHVLQPKYGERPALDFSSLAEDGFPGNGASCEAERCWDGPEDFMHRMFRAKKHTRIAHVSVGALRGARVARDHGASAVTFEPVRDGDPEPAHCEIYAVRVGHAEQSAARNGAKPTIAWTKGSSGLRSRVRRELAMLFVLDERDYGRHVVDE